MSVCMNFTPHGVGDSYVDVSCVSFDVPCFVALYVSKPDGKRLRGCSVCGVGSSSMF